MIALNDRLAQGWTRVAPRLLPFADAASPELPLGRLMRLSLFQVSVGIALVLLTGTLNRVMIVELGVPAWLVALMVALPTAFAPARALVGFRSDTHRSLLGWRRVPYLWFGTLLVFGGFAIMPFALLLLGGDGPAWIGRTGAAAAFLLVGAGMHTTQTAGLALATDLAPAGARPRVVALLYMMLLVATVAAAATFGLLLDDFGPIRLIKVVQGAAVVTLALNIVALWKQEPRDPSRTRADAPRASFRQACDAFVGTGRNRRLLWAVGLGTMGFTMQDILLEPYGGQVMHLSVSATTALTALMACGSLVAFALAAHRLARGHDPYRIAAMGVLVGVVAFSAVVFAQPIGSGALFRVGTFLIGLGGGLFSVATLTIAMGLDGGGNAGHGLALGAWGAVQASAAGLGIAAGGVLRDLFGDLAARGMLGATPDVTAIGYTVVYHVEIALLFATLAAIGPLVRRSGPPAGSPGRFGLAEFPG